MLKLKKKTIKTMYVLAIILSLLASSIVILTYFGIKPFSLAPGQSNIITSTSIQQDNLDYKTILFNFKSSCGDGTTNIPYGVNSFNFGLSNLQDYILLPEYQPNESPFLISDYEFSASSVSIIDGIMAEAKCKVRKVGPRGSKENCPNIPGCTCTVNPDGSTECSNGGKLTFRIEVYDCQVKGNYTCNNPPGCDIPNFCNINIIFNAYKEGHLPECPIGQIKCNDGVCRENCNQCLNNQVLCDDGICKDSCEEKINYFVMFIVILVIIFIVAGLSYFYIYSLKSKRKR